MNSKKEYLNKRIRDTLASLPDEELLRIIKNSPLDYTPFALQAAREELSKRKQLRSLRKDMSAARETTHTMSQGDRVCTNTTGCYIEVWRDKSFEGEYLLIEGPAEYEALISAGEDWGDDIGSLRVGPNAFVLTYEDKRFRGEMICFGPCEEVADLSKLNFNDEIDSMRVIESIRIFEKVKTAGEQEAKECE